MSKPVVCKLKLNGNTFEALCNGAKIKEFREGKCSIHDVLADSDNVYKNSSKGERWAGKDLEAAFETSKAIDVLTRIVEKGTAPVSTEENREDTASKKREIIHYLASKYVDPKTGRPQPATRIESALDSLKGLSIDPKRDASMQANELVRKIIDSGLPMRKVEMEGTVSVATKHQKATQELLRKMSTITGTSFKGPEVVFSIALAPSDLEGLQKQLAKITTDFVFDLPPPPSSGGASTGGGGGGGGGGGKKGKKGKN